MKEQKRKKDAEKQKNAKLLSGYSQEELDEIANEVQNDFLGRQQERKPYEAQWLLNLNFLLGNQYCAISPNGEVTDYDKQFFWQEREVYNHIAPLIESRISKLNRVRPSMTVVPASTDENDCYTAKVSKKILDSCKNKFCLSEMVSDVTLWSEITGTSFYKVVWNSNLGAVIGQTENGEEIREGEIEITVCPPYEIYPDNFCVSSLDDCKSIIHAKAYDAETIKDIWGVEVRGQDLNVFSLDSVSNVGGLGFSSTVNKACAKIKKNHAIVIEKYEKPTKKYPNGRLIIVCDNQVIHISELPFINKDDGVRGFPFIKQTASEVAGNFWGVSVIERCIPVQRSYNAVKNRKHEFLNRLSMGVLTVEDGSVDTDNLMEEGISPGKILVYRQGSTPPGLLATGKVPTDFVYEEERLLQEFTLLSGVSDLMRSSGAISSNMSGVAMQLLIEQDDSRLTHTAENIRVAQKHMAEQILRLYKQFAVMPRLNKLIGTDGSVDMFYFKSSDISSDDVIFETENEMGETLAQKRSMVFDLLNAGLLSDDEGKLSSSMKVKVLDLLGFGIWQGAQDLSSLQVKKADNENIMLSKNTNILPTEIDDNKIHLNEHIAFMLSNEFDKLKERQPEIEKLFLEHIRAHKMIESQTQEIQK